MALLSVQLPKGTKINCADTGMLVKLYRRTGRLRKSKLHLPETSLGETFFGRIANIGVGRIRRIDEPEKEGGSYKIVREPVPYHVGDDVVFHRYHGERLQIGGVMHILMEIDDILATIKLPDDEDFSEYFKFDTDEENEALSAAYQ